MIGELDLCGVFVSPLLAWGAIALALHAVLRWVLGQIGFYRVVWHAALADLALLVLVFSAVARILPEWIG